MLTVMKFGGSSLAGIGRLRNAANIAIGARQRGNVLVVVSAMGDTTDELIALARQISEHPSERELDALTTTGEQQSAALMAITLQSLGADACSLTGWQAGLLTDARHGGADIRLIAPLRIGDALSHGQIAVVTGYQGFSPDGDLTTLGRGGSDTTAVALAAALHAEVCEIYTDVNGICTADPRRLPEARRWERIDYRDMLALAEGGSQVLHPKSVELAMRSGVRLRLLSSTEQGKGTELCFLDDAERPPYAGVTRDVSRSAVTLAGKSADGAALSELILLLAAKDIRVTDAALGTDRVSLTVASEQLDAAMATVHREMLL